MSRFATIGCRECHHYWIVEDLRRQDTVECPRCGDVRESSIARVQEEADSWRVACEQRARLLAQQADQYKPYVHNWDDFGVLEDEIETSVATTAPDESPLFTDAFADEAAEHLEQWSEQRREALQDEAEAYLDRRFATITPETDAGDGYRLALPFATGEERGAEIVPAPLETRTSGAADLLLDVVLEEVGVDEAGRVGDPDDPLGEAFYFPHDFSGLRDEIPWLDPWIEVAHALCDGPDPAPVSIQFGADIEQTALPRGTLAVTSSTGRLTN